MNAIKTILVGICLVLAMVNISISQAETMDGSITAPREVAVELLGILASIFISCAIFAFTGVGWVIFFAFIILLGILGIAPQIIIFIIIVIISFIISAIVGIILILPTLPIFGFAILALIACGLAFVGILAFTAFLLFSIAVGGIGLVGVVLILGAIGVAIGLGGLLLIFGFVFSLVLPPFFCISGFLIIQRLVEKAKQKIRQCINIALCGLPELCNRA